MDGSYRLIFRGELLEGQHRAVVKRRLGELLKLDGERLEQLFSGRSIVVKRDVDRTVAARYQAVFRKAGAHLRVVDESGTTAKPQPDKPAASSLERENPAAAAARAVSAPADRETGAQRSGLAGRPAANPDIDAPDYSVVTSYFPPPAEPASEITAPDLEIAAPGEPLGPQSPVPAAAAIEVEFELAEPGADLLDERPAKPTVSVTEVSFELAEVGADLGPQGDRAVPAAPDTSHLSLTEDGA